MIPRPGSAYTYGYVALGEIIGWFIGWDLLLEYIAIVAVVAIGISGYFTEFMSGIGLDVPVWMQGTGDQLEGGMVNLPAIVVCLLVTFILSRGAKTFGPFELIAVCIKVLLILFIIGLGFFFINAENYDPFMPNGFGPVFAGAATVFFAVFGYDAMSTAAEEATDGKKHMPKAILLSLAIAMTLYVLATLVLTGMQNWSELDPDGGIRGSLPVGGPARGRHDHFGIRGDLDPHRHADVPPRRHARLVLDEPGRPAAQVVLRHRHARHPAAGDLDRGDRGGIPGRGVPDPGGRRPDEHRHPRGLRRGLHRGDRASPHPARSCHARSGCRSCPWFRPSACSPHCF